MGSLESSKSDREKLSQSGKPRAGRVLGFSMSRETAELIAL